MSDDATTAGISPRARNGEGTPLLKGVSERERNVEINTCVTDPREIAIGVRHRSQRGYRRERDVTPKGNNDKNLRKKKRRKESGYDTSTESNRYRMRGD